MAELEKESLEAHVDMCSERYNGLHRELKHLGERMDKFEKMLTGIFLLLIMVGGMGLGARLGVLKGGWPLWINIFLGK